MTSLPRPWDDQEGNLVLLGEGDAKLSFGQAEIQVVDEDQQAGQFSYAEVLDLYVSVPTFPMWLWWVMAPIFLLVPAALIRNPEIYVRIMTRDGYRHFSLGRPADAPYDVSTASATDALMDHLEPEGYARLAGEGGVRLMAQAQALRSWSIRASARRFRRASL